MLGYFRPNLWSHVTFLMSWVDPQVPVVSIRVLEVSVARHDGLPPVIIRILDSDFPTKTIQLLGVPPLLRKPPGHRNPPSQPQVTWTLWGSRPESEFAKFGEDLGKPLEICKNPKSSGELTLCY